MEKLPAQAKRMWAKTPGGGFGRSTPARESDTMLPLYVHMGDSAEVATKLWETWVPDGVKALIHPDQALAHRLFRFLAAVHDIGKATPAFQLKSEFLAEGIGLTMPFISKPSEIPHGLAGHWILCEQGFNKSVAVVVGGHHGIPPTASELERVSAYTKHTGAGMSEWREVQDALLQYACRLAGMAEHDLKQAKFELHVQALLTGLVIMTDWLASDESRFSYLPYPPVYTQAPSSRRAADAWESLGLPPYWSAAGLPDDIGSLFQARFGIEAPRPLQLEAVRALSETKAPGIIVIEAPMGIGKTETALVAAEILAERTGRGGAFVGLPTMATSDAMFGRVKRWVDALASDADTDYSMFLAHGKSTLNDEYQGLIAELRVGDSGEESAVANEWLQGRKKGVLADFVVGTVDQLLFMALKTRHVVLRHLALANKVVIIDECHAYDAYMNCYLERALEWLGKYRTPVILLSATLPETTRRKLIDAYMGPSPRPGQGAPPCSENPAASGAHPPLAHKWAQPASPATKPLWASNRAYPLITYSDGGEIRQAAVPQSGRVTEVSFEHLPDSALPDKLHSLLSGGGCAGIICNTVDRAQQTVQILKDHFAGTGTDIELIHARFVGADRMQKEKKLRGRLGPQSRTEDGSRPQRFIVVGTQVLEQSLDIDFDLLVSDIAPMDLLLQRVGRLHRHDRTRPEKLSKAMCFVTGIEDAAGWQFASAIEMVYSRYMLLNTLLLLPTAPDCVTLPDDISPLVQKAYTEPGEDGTSPACTLIGQMPDREAAALKLDEYRRALGKHIEQISHKESKAGAFRLRAPGRNVNASLVDLLNVTRGDKSDHKAEASVRDTAESLEVVAIQRRRGGRLHLLPWIGDPDRGVRLGAEIATGHVPEADVARVTAACTVSLPMALCNPRLIDDVIEHLEKEACNSGIECWQESPMLRGMLPLILEDPGDKPFGVLNAEVCGHELEYSKDMGLSVKRKET